jgi:cytochrome P450
MDPDPGTAPDLFDPFASHLIADPHPTYQVLRDFHPVYHSPSRDIWALSRYADVQTGLRDWARYSSASGVDFDHSVKELGSSFLEMDPPRHKELRDVVRREFAPRAIAAREGGVRAHVRELLSARADGEPWEAIRSLAWPLPVVVMSDLLGIPDGDRQRVGDILHTFIARVPGDPGIPQNAIDAATELRAYFRDLVDERRRRPEDDLVSYVAAELPRRQDDREDDAIATCNLLLLAGIDSVADLIGLSLMVLERFPDQRGLVCQDRALLPAAIEEVLRYETPVPNLKRTLTEDVALHDVTIPQGATVALLSGAANRDGRHFTDPDTFDVTRAVPRHLGFGEGIHFCVGAPLARLQARIVVDMVLNISPEYSCAHPPTWIPRQSQRGLEELYLTL